VETNTIIRDAFYSFLVKNESRISGDPPYVVGILGGGIRNASARFRESTQILGELIINACNALAIEKATIRTCLDDICECE